MRLQGQHNGFYARFFRRVQHGKHAASAPVRQDIAFFRAENVRNIRFGAGDTAAGAGEVVRIGKFGDVPFSDLMPGRMERNVPLFGALFQHLPNVARFQYPFVL